MRCQAPTAYSTVKNTYNTLEVLKLGYSCFEEASAVITPQKKAWKRGENNLGLHVHPRRSLWSFILKESRIQYQHHLHQSVRLLVDSLYSVASLAWILAEELLNAFIAFVSDESLLKSVVSLSDSILTLRLKHVYVMASEICKYLYGLKAQISYPDYDWETGRFSSYSQ